MGKDRLIDITGAVGTTYMGVLRHAKVSSATTEEGWNIRGKCSRYYHDLYNCIMAIEPPKPEKGKDIVLQKNGVDDFKPNFLAAKTWEQLRSKRNKEVWSKVVWFPQGVPRYSFITWLAIKNRMRQWRMTQKCDLCGERDKTRDHLFFACPYTYTVWESLAWNLLGTGINPDWQWTLHHIQRMGVKGVDSCLARLLFQTAIYLIWRERNARRHQQPRTSTKNMRKLVHKGVKNRISSFKYKSNHMLEGLLRRWFQVTL
ncbi:hypothetical protein N665_2862s0002 [Sinapis alba]|nr:hypothetical protein N665_2862s0002 [Sinapis alba]